MTKYRVRWQLRAALLALVAPLVTLTGPVAAPANAAQAPTYKHARQWIYSTQASENVSAVAVDRSGRVYVAGNRIGQRAVVRVYNANGKLRNTWDPLGFDIVGGIAVAPNGQIHISDFAGADPHTPSSVNVFKPNGTFVRSYGLPGTAWSAGGLTIAGNGTAYVADPVSHAIHRFKPNGTYDTSLGSATGAGTAPGVYDSPSDVAIAPGGRLAVADSGNHRVQLVSANTGAPVRHWGEAGTSNGRFVGSVVSIEVHRKRVYVLDWTSRIQIFTLKGKHLSTAKATTRRKGHVADELSDIAFGPGNQMYVGARLYPFENGVARYNARKSSRVKVTGNLKATKNRKKAKLPAKCVKGKTKCTGKVTVKKGTKTFATGKVKLGRNKSANVTLKLTQAARKALKKKARIPVQVKVKLSTGTTSTKVRLTR